MQLKLFNLRLSPEQTPQDQDVINSFMNTVTVKKSATQYVPGDPDYWSILVYYDESNGTATKSSSKTPEISEADLNEDQKHILTALKTWRKDKANDSQVAEFMILHNSTLCGLAQAKPRTMTDLNSIKGLGSQKIAKYGDDLIAILNAF
ncbi:MAG TPA: HRDC domain-containing protein [Saprospiraceae bacterium]|nr:HRDC domain-containing protein [Saprospiraceae bacterium]